MIKKLTNPSTIINIILIITLLAIFLFGPYKFLHSLNSEAILKDPRLSEALENYNVTSVEYKGNNTYLINTQTKNLMVVQDYTSTMDYKWKVFNFAEEIN